jgi:hypothetical protein
MKNKLLNAMKALPMTIEDKQEFVNTILNNSKGDGEAILYYYKFDNNSFIEEFESDFGGSLDKDTILMLINLITLPAAYIWYNGSDDADGHHLTKQVSIDPTLPSWALKRIEGFIIEDCSLMIYPYFAKGEYKQKFEKLSNAFADFEELMPIIELIDKHLTLVSKEEFYSKLDKQPIIL